MKYLMIPGILAALASCSAPAPGLDTSEALVVQLIGNDGAAAGQTNIVTLTPDGTLSCRFMMAASPFDGAEIDDSTVFWADASLYPDLRALILQNGTSEPGTQAAEFMRATGPDGAVTVIAQDIYGLANSDLGQQAQRMIDTAIAPESCFLWG